MHGGGWLAGNKDDLKPWAEILAGEGFSVVAPNYSLAPEHTYPLPVSQTNKAVNYIVEYAAQLSIDPEKLLLAGDSAGAQIAAQVALIHTNPTYAKNIGMSPSQARHTIAGLLLNCGPYDLRLAQGDTSSAGAKLVRTFLWSYTGHKDFMKAPRIEYASIPKYVTKDFPASFITVGNVDPLAPHSYALAKALKDVDVQTDTLFYADDHQPALNHEYQFNLDTADGKTALSRMMTFAKQVVQ